MDSDNLYFARRAAEERRAAELAIDPVARSTHLELACRYGELADAMRQTSEGALPTGNRAYLKVWADW